MTVRLMSRLEVLRDLDHKRLMPKAVGQLLGLERRQVFRLLKAYRAEGAAGLISKRRGRSYGLTSAPHPTDPPNSFTRSFWSAAGLQKPGDEAAQ